MCFDILYNFLSETFLILRTKHSMIKMYTGLHMKYPLVTSDFNVTWIFWTEFWKILKYQISWKSVQRELSSPRRWTGEQTDRHDTAYSRFSQFCKRA